MKQTLFIFLFLINSIFAQNIWEPFGEMQRPVAGGDIWIHPNFGIIFILGGYSDSTQSNVNWIQAYDSNWHLDSMRISRFGLVAESYKNRVLIFGGVFENLENSQGLERWGSDIDEESFVGINSTFNRIFSSGHIIGDNLYIIGGNPLPGTGQDSLPYIVEYSIPQSEITFTYDSFNSSGDLPEQQMTEVIGNDIFVFGGVINGISQDIYKFNVVNKTYEKLDVELNEPRAGGRAVRLREENKIYIIGGYNESSEALNTVEVFYIEGENYYVEHGPSLINARYNFMAGLFNENIIVMGGFDADGDVLNSIETLSEVAVVDVSGSAENLLGENFKLNQNYPNPFNPSTTVGFSVPVLKGTDNSMMLSIVIFDVLGNEIRSLTNKRYPPGNYNIEFDGTGLPSGVYYYQLKTKNYVETKKMILLK